jgi:hypothetical protein
MLCTTFKLTNPQSNFSIILYHQKTSQHIKGKLINPLFRFYFDSLNKFNMISIFLLSHFLFNDQLFIVREKNNIISYIYFVFSSLFFENN